MATSSEPPRRRLAAILAADIAGYSALMGADDARTVRDLKGHQAVVLPMIQEMGGRVIDTAGDGVLAEFASVVNAVECALAIQRTMAERNGAIEPARRMQFRIGINLGDVIYDDVRLYGDGINIAARLEALAEPGGICVSEKAFEEVRDRIRETFIDQGVRELKNISRPVRVYTYLPRHSVADPSPKSSFTNALRLPDKPSIAILPFTNMGSEQEQEYFADGIVEDILTTLSQVSSLFVVARNSSFVFKGQSVDVREVGRRLGVQYILEGSVRRSGERLRVTAQLVDVANGTHLWSERYDRRVQDVFDIQDDLTKEIVTALRIQLTDGEQASIWLRSTNSVEAWGYATRGADHMWRGTAADMVQARSFLERAVACDPTHAKAAALIAVTHYFDIRFNYTSSKDVSKRQATEWTSRALRLNPDEPYAILMRGSLNTLEGRFGDAVDDARLAVIRSPNDAFVWLVLARILVNAERPTEAENAIRHAMRLNPFYPVNYLAVLGDALVHQGTKHEARDVFDEIVRRQPRYISAHLHLAGLYSSLGDMSRARAAVAAVLELDPDYRVTAAASFYLSSDETRKRAFLDSLRAAGLPD